MSICHSNPSDPLENASFQGRSWYSHVRWHLIPQKVSWYPTGLHPDSNAILWKIIRIKLLNFKSEAQNWYIWGYFPIRIHLEGFFILGAYCRCSNICGGRGNPTIWLGELNKYFAYSSPPCCFLFIPHLFFFLRIKVNVLFQNHRPPLSKYFPWIFIFTFLKMFISGIFSNYKPVI